MDVLNSQEPLNLPYGRSAKTVNFGRGGLCCGRLFVGLVRGVSLPFFPGWTTQIAGRTFELLRVADQLEGGWTLSEIYD